jgi:NhaA family Na+:H+ antiporter
MIAAPDFSVAVRNLGPVPARGPFFRWRFPAMSGRINSTLRRFLDSEASGGVLLMVVACLAIIVANTPLAPLYFKALHTYLGPLSLLHWINDALMALFFLMVGLEIKREMLDGQLASWDRRALPGLAAAAGMAVPAAIFVAFNYREPAVLRGWAIPTATDIAFALGVLSLLGPRVPASLKVFLAALAIIDDLGAVIVIAVFYTANLSWFDLIGAAAVMVVLVEVARWRTNTLAPYLLLGAVLWVFVLRSGVHATIAGVALAMTIPIQKSPARPEASPSVSPLHRLEHALHKPVAFLIVPIFGFANAGVSFAGMSLSILLEPLTLGIAVGLVLGKLLGVFGSVLVLAKLKIANLPAGATWTQMCGVSLLCGIGFTMSLFIGLLAFPDAALQDRMKVGILAGSLLAGAIGATILLLAPRRRL